jgi:hypothetical protein
VTAILRGEGGPKRPFFFVPVDEATSNDYGRAYLVRYQGNVDETARPFYGIYTFTVPLLEEV